MTETQNHWLSIVHVLLKGTVTAHVVLCLSQVIEVLHLVNASLRVFLKTHYIIIHYIYVISHYVILAFWLVTYDLLTHRCKDSLHSWQDWWMSVFFWSCSRYVNLMFVEPQVKINLTPHQIIPSQLCVPFFCSYYILMSSVICYWMDTRQHGM